MVTFVLEIEMILCCDYGSWFLAAEREETMSSDVCAGVNVRRTREEVQGLVLRGMEDEIETVAGRATTSKLLTYCGWLSASMRRLPRP